MSIKTDLEFMTAKCARLEAELAEKDDMRVFEIIMTRVDNTNKWNLAYENIKLSAQLIKRDNNTFVATAEYVHSPEETASNKAIQSLFEHKRKCDELASSSEVF